METVGIRELKTHLSRHLKRVRSARLLVTERGRSIATISPVEAPADLTLGQSARCGGGAPHWSGGKPTGAKDPVSLSGKPSASPWCSTDRR